MCYMYSADPLREIRAHGPRSVMTHRLASIFLVSLGLGACDSAEPVEPAEAAAVPELGLAVDPFALEALGCDFSFLRPVEDDPSTTSPFDGSHTPTVTICHLGEDHGCDGPPVLRVDGVTATSDNSHYQVVFDTDALGLGDGDYRARVLLRGENLGAVDIAVRDGGSALKLVDANLAYPAKLGRQIAVRFHIGTDCPGA